MLRGRETIEPRWCEIVVTVNGAIHGAMFDTIRWRGWLQPLRLQGRVVRRNDQIPLNASPAQSVREYPILERPEEMRALSEKLRLGKRD